ncbi:MAG: hypothetical protein GXZ11_05260 [Tissierellia bacterium]|nr:hypothetical protein [Tissierellia bacterium]
MPEDGHYYNSEGEDSATGEWWLSNVGNIFTLTLNNANITNDDGNSLFAGGNINIVLAEGTTNNIGNSELSQAIHSEGYQLNISGGGTLNIKGSSSDFRDCSLTISDNAQVNINVKIQQDYYNETALRINKGVTVKDGAKLKVTVDSMGVTPNNSYGIDTNNIVVRDGGELIAKASGATNNYAAKVTGAITAKYYYEGDSAPGVSVEELTDTIDHQSAFGTKPYIRILGENVIEDPIEITYIIDATAGENGRINPSGKSTVTEGADKTYYISPAAGYEISDVLVDGISVGAVKEYTFTNVVEDHTISATFKKTAEQSPATGGGFVLFSGFGGTKPETAKPAVDSDDKLFIDVDKNDWFYDAVMYCVKENLMKGTDDKVFSPNTTTTRGMIVTILYRLEKEPSVTQANKFGDVDNGIYYHDAIIWATENDIVTGYGNNIFGPEDDITREQIAAILYRYMKYKGKDISGGEKFDLTTFNDLSSVSDWAEAAVKWACDSKIIKGDNGNILPTKNATRAEVAEMLYRLIK